ncbi:MAG: valine--tRNA ligase [Elusimicrobia bacterium]|nr:valine--tRNA ligase [Elusimicrobiota bacterium]
MEISKTYEPKEVEKKWLKDWEDKKLYYSQPDERTPFTIVIPPPNVTGSLHMGHALNNLLQDIIIRFKRMNGFNACWVPGTDHGGIATQNVVEKLLKKAGKSRENLGRNEFINEMWRWRKETGDTILTQLKKLGCSCDWLKTSFTMDDKRSKAVNTAFIEFFNKGLIYRGLRWVDWCTRCETALNESEVEQEDEKGKLWYIKYPIQNSSQVQEFSGSQVSNNITTQEHKNIRTDFIVIATTRPETMLGDTAVAVNPDDKRYKKFIGKTAVLPLVNRPIPIVADGIVDPEFGTGALKITPAHDQNDDTIAKNHNLKYIGAIDIKGKITHNITQDLEGKNIADNDVSDLIGKPRDEARKIVIDRLKEKGFLEKEEDYIGPKKRCYRCETIVESFSSMQWFLKMDDMAKRAIDSAKKGETKFFPERWLKPYLLWLENLKDWCISRQIWWGHRIPLWYCTDCAGGHILCEDEKNPGGYKNLDTFSDTEKKQTIQQIQDGSKKYFIVNITKDTKGVYSSEKKPEKCECGSSELIQDPDVLDTWFSSALWPLSVFGWPDNDSSQVLEFSGSQVSNNTRTQEHKNIRTHLDYYYPTNVLVTGHEILYLWVARMIMMGLEFKNKVPYSDVYIHGIVRDSKGKKMSKSLGNVIDPLEIMEKYGTDALRLALAHQGIPGRDMQISDENFTMARNFTNKLWNASRFVLIHMGTRISQITATDYADNDLTDKWIISELNSTIKNVTKAIENYNPAEASRLLYEFIWSKYCDWYVEFSKTRLYGEDEKSKLAAQKIHLEVLEKILKMLHPIMPFITEEIFQNLKKQNTSIMLSEYPKYDTNQIDSSAQTKIQKIMDTITLIRNFIAEMNIKPENLTYVYFKTSDASKKIILENMHYIEMLTKVKKESIQFRENLPHISSMLGDIQFLPELSLKAEDTEKIIKRLESQLQKIDKELKVYENKVSNENFIKKANPAEVERVKQKHQEALEKKKKIEESIKTLRRKT